MTNIPTTLIQMLARRLGMAARRAGSVQQSALREDLEARVFRGFDRPYSSNLAGRDTTWSAADPETANTYAVGDGANVESAILRLTRPLHVNANGAVYGAFSDDAYEPFFGPLE